MDQQEQKIKAVEKALGEPVLLDFSENTLKTRRNLLTVSTIALAFWIGDLKVGTSPTLLGITVENLTHRTFVLSLIAVLAYLLIHFMWLAWDGFLEWQLRITGTRVTYLTASKFSPDGIDAPGDPRQSTLYRWWLEQAQPLKLTYVKIGDLEAGLQALKAAEKALGTNASIDAETAGQIAALAGNLSSVEAQLRVTTEVVQSARIPVSLERFDRRWHYFLKSQNLRWILLEAGLPVCLALSGLFACVRMLPPSIPQPSPTQKQQEAPKPPANAPSADSSSGPLRRAR